MIQKINLNNKLLNTEIRKQKARVCADRLLKIMQSDEFREEILNMDRNYWLQGEDKNSKIYRLDNSGIYELLMSGAEEWNNEVDYEIDLIVDDYLGKMWSKVVGYMNPGKPTVYVNTRFFDTMSKMKVCSNFGHEWSHTMGARHPDGPYLRMSFAYFMNHVIEKLYKQKFGNNERTQAEFKRIYKRVWWKAWLGKKCYLVRK